MTMQQPKLEPVTLDDVVITEKLFCRTFRSPNLQAENQALHTLARQLVNQPEAMLRSLVAMALDLCQAGTAGVSLLEVTSNGEELFRWKVLAGALAKYEGGTTPRNFSPCGTCLDRGTPQLYFYPERYFTYFQATETQIIEGLVLPLMANNHAFGTIWIVSHDKQRHFDPEDVRVMSSLADFTAAALLLNQQQTQALLEKNARLEAEISERKRAEEVLRQSEKRLRRVIAIETVGIIFFRTDGNITDVNDAFLQMSGYSREDFEQGLVRREELTPSEWMPASLYAIEELKSTGCTTPYEKEYIRKDGSRWWALFAAKILDEEEGVEFLIDITDRKRAEVEREQLLTREQAARQQAETANRVKDEFLAVLSHELRSPLTPILAWAGLLKSRSFDEQTTKHALATIEQNAKLQIQLVEDLLDISSILHGKLSLHATPVNLKLIIKAALETISLAAIAKSIRIETVFEPNLPRVLGDSTRLQQVVWNLLTNAIKFTPAGGNLKVTLKKIGTQAQIRISDTGRGISPEFLPYLFESFRQADSSTTRTFGGLGLGLAIVRQVVELHGGRVQAESLGEGQGASFTIYLQLLQEHQIVIEGTQQDLSIAQSPAPLEGKKILLIDDEADTRKVLAFVLEQAGAVVIAVASAQEALEKLKQNKPNVLISDIGMPNMDGYMLISQIRALD
ncbi:ATP-binding protein [Lyngbya aestuarii]|uniref:ATP-binding protein n=1 Tax=Lyngbya aestuarii TaxID=118322 RepID=UPI00403E072B